MIEVERPCRGQRVPRDARHVEGQMDRLRLAGTPFAAARVEHQVSRTTSTSTCVPDRVCQPSASPGPTCTSTLAVEARLAFGMGRPFIA